MSSYLVKPNEFFHRFLHDTSYTMASLESEFFMYTTMLIDRPCRPSKFLLDVDAHLSPGSSLSGFIAYSSYQYVVLSITCICTSYIRLHI